jgi:hypothetical protein
LRISVLGKSKSTNSPRSIRESHEKYYFPIPPKVNNHDFFLLTSVHVMKEQRKLINSVIQNYFTLKKESSAFHGSGKYIF